ACASCVSCSMRPTLPMSSSSNSPPVSDKPALSVALLQFNPFVGDLSGNARAIVEGARHAHAQGAQLVVAPELALCGYPPEDLLLRPAFIQAADAAMDDMARALADLPELTVVVGRPLNGTGQDLRTRSVSAPRLLNVATVLRAGEGLGDRKS